jgi:hypothetical protein
MLTWNCGPRNDSLRTRLYKSMSSHTGLVSVLSELLLPLITERLCSWPRVLVRVIYLYTGEIISGSVCTTTFEWSNMLDYVVMAELYAVHVGGCRGTHVCLEFGGELEW